LFSLPHKVEVADLGLEVEVTDLGLEIVDVDTVEGVAICPLLNVFSGTVLGMCATPRTESQVQ
jgi:hypothetical protein